MILDFTEELPPLTNDEVYQVFVNTLDLLSGFSILFLQCPEGEVKRLIPKVCQELPRKNIGVLELAEPIQDLYSIVKNRSDCEALNILFVRGLENSLKDDVKPGYKGLGNYYNLNTVPAILSHLNQQRENFRDYFPNICFVFVLPKFAIRYFVRRAPDFYDWNSGLFEIAGQEGQEEILSTPDKSDINNSTTEAKNQFSDLFSLTSKQPWYKKILAKIHKLWSNDSKEAIYWIQGNSLYNVGKYEEAIASYDRAISFKLDKHEAWYNQGNSLGNLGRHEEAIASYDRAISFKLDKHEAWNNRGSALDDLGRYEEAIESYDRAISFKPDKHEAWYNRGVALVNLGRYEEAIESYDRAIAFKPDKHEAWSGRGVALVNLGRYEEAIESYDRAIAFKPDLHEAWYNRGISLRELGRYEEAIESYDRAIAFKPDLHEAWHNRGYALDELGRYEEAIKSYDRAIASKPDKHEAWHNKGWSYFKWNKYPESIDCYDHAIVIKPDKYDSWHDKGLVQFVTSDYVASLASWQQAFSYISDPAVPRYYKDISGLIQEFIEELIPRFTQPPIQQTLLIPLLAIYQESNVITELGAALVNTLHLIVAPAISDHTATQWLTLWQTSNLGQAPTMELPLRLMATAIEYKKDPSKRQRLWLNLPSEERPILDKALKLLD
jgi:tetratricopeptide (TPR) repeat protein